MPSVLRGAQQQGRVRSGFATTHIFDGSIWVATMGIACNIGLMLSGIMPLVADDKDQARASNHHESIFRGMLLGSSNRWQFKEECLRQPFESLIKFLEM